MGQFAFGDAVTETDWHHLWLSEGFATYFGALFFEHDDGPARFRELMDAARQRYLRSDRAGRPVLDTTETDLFALLDENNYQKGAWVLHMLRRLTGDSAFFRGIRDYYHAHAHGNALTDDLRRALERAAGTDLGWFFDQWLRRPGYPRLRTTWRWDAARRAAELTIEQTQPEEWPTFRFPLALEAETPRGTTRDTILVERRRTTARIRLPARPTTIRLDPDHDLLAEILPPEPAPPAAPGRPRRR